ncbi:MAG: FKBP-type peptidyl-prolyl cis-trans isomerase [Candidatus Chaera renei]|uniref:Peptidyl-prolyl cis-trans isomerase n=1 Tax=Candidatus Chaera renei TaxID=2506947 RepID=A0A4Q0AKE5_9BACT|nr:MAG: FKBP-type peptidyl-prolyl cis-trans isomerase [Candidatus Chaera renei]
MAVGSLGTYFLVILANNNQADQAAKQQAEIAKLQQQLKCDPVSPPSGKTYAKPPAQPFDKNAVTQLKTEDVAKGSGPAISSGDACVTVHYLGNLADGTVFDNSYDRSQPIAIKLSQVIGGWQQGLQGMQAGGVRKLYIPADLAYGASGSPPVIGPNQPLYFYIELIGFSQ